MPRETHTYDLENVLEELDSELDELADEAMDVDEGVPRYEEIAQHAAEVEQHLTGVQWALEEFGEDDEPVTVTLGALSAGEHGQMVTLANKGHGDASAGAQRQIFVGVGLQDASFLEDSVTDTNANPDSHRELIGTVAGWAPQFVHWLEAEIDDLTTPEVETKNWHERLAERQSDAKPNTP